MTCRQNKTLRIWVPCVGLLLGNYLATDSARAQATANSTPSGHATDGPQGNGTDTLQSVIVTAQKYSQNLQDVPVPVSVINGQSLLEKNELRLQDYFSEVPGLILSQGSFNFQYVAIRGISSNIGGVSTATSVMLDDVPFGGTYVDGGNVMPDIDPGELSRLEVLRGPQGTLYGASSMGGLVKYVTLDPSTSEFSGRVQVGTSSVSHGATLGYNVRASANIPVNDTLAIRVSGFSREEPGYINDVVTGQRGVNEQHVSGGHLATLWSPSEQWSLKLSAYFQDARASGVNNVVTLPGFGEWDQNTPRDSGASNTKVQAYSATLKASLGSAELISITGYNKIDSHANHDFSGVFTSLVQQNFPVSGTYLAVTVPTAKFSQEIRVSGSLTQKIDWLLGVFYTHESIPESDYSPVVDPVTGVRYGSLIFEKNTDWYAEYAGFANLTYHFTDRFNVQVGARQSHITDSQLYHGYGILFGSPTSTYDIPLADSSANAFTYLLSPQFKASEDLMFYARLASGYRAGGANSYVGGSAATYGLPPSYAPDKTYDYDLGVKGEFLDHKLSVDASIFYIDWKHIQLGELYSVPSNPDIPTQSYTSNANRAKSEGIELAIRAKPLKGLSVSGWIDYDNGALVDGFPPNSTSVGEAGARIPYSTRWSGNLAIQQEAALSSRVNGFVGGMLAYLGDHFGSFQSGPQRQYYPPYAKLDLRAGLHFDAWTMSGYATNVLNRRALLSGALESYPAGYATYIQPRTIGLNLSLDF